LPISFPAQDPSTGKIYGEGLSSVVKLTSLAQSPFDRIENSLKTSGDLEFLEDAVQMALDCFLTDEEVLGDFFIG
jgi:hypothetical protein